MKKRILKIAAFITALALIIGVSAFANSLVGNPISKALAKNAAEKHIEKAYGGKNFETERIGFSFKDGYYHAFITLPGSIDSDFTLMIDMWGKVCIDTYEDRVLTGWNTADRIGRDYRKKVNEILESRAFPYDEHIGYGDIEFIPEQYKDDPNVPEYAIITESLTRDAFYDVNELGAKAGKLTIYIDDDMVTVERMAEILLDIKGIFDNASVKFHAIDCVLSYPGQEEGSSRGERIEVMDFLYSEIYEDSMAERVAAYDEAAKKYHAQQDLEK